MAMKAFCLIVATSLIAPSLVGCASGRGPRQIDSGSYGRGSVRPESNWSRVGEIEPGKEVRVVARGRQPVFRYFVRVGPSDITLLNLTDPTLPDAAIRMLRDLASERPEGLAATQTKGAFAEGGVRVSREGVFIAERKAAELGEVLQVIARSDVVEISGPVVARGSVLGALLGGYVGLAVGVLPGLGGAPSAAAWSALIGSIAVGGMLGSHWSSHETDGLIYRAP
jgi:hypothetical protein